MYEDQELALLTLTDFMKLAEDRGVRLWTFEEEGVTWITNGTRRYPLYIHWNGYLAVDYVVNLCRLFSLESVDFALDSEEED